MKENWYALCLVALKNITIEQALDLITGKINIVEPSRISNKTITKDDVIGMARYKKNHTWDEVAEVYGLSKYGAYNRVRRYKEKTARTPTKVVQAAI